MQHDRSTRFVVLNQPPKAVSVLFPDSSNLACDVGRPWRVLVACDAATLRTTPVAV